MNAKRLVAAVQAQTRGHHGRTVKRLLGHKQWGWGRSHAASCARGLRKESGLHGIASLKVGWDRKLVAWKAAWPEICAINERNIANEKQP
jgi:hypothetical protein